MYKFHEKPFIDYILKYLYKYGFNVWDWWEVHVKREYEYQEKASIGRYGTGWTIIRIKNN
jgi:hypothetical protein